MTTTEHYKGFTIYKSQEHGEWVAVEPGKPTIRYYASTKKALKAEIDFALADRALSTI